jgi:hypothetical protein
MNRGDITRTWRVSTCISISIITLTLAGIPVGQHKVLSAQTPQALEMPKSYRYWFHVNTMIVDKESPLYSAIGGMHNVHVNSAGRWF